MSIPETVPTSFWSNLLSLVLPIQLSKGLRGLRETGGSHRFFFSKWEEGSPLFFLDGWPPVPNFCARLIDCAAVSSRAHETFATVLCFEKKQSLTLLPLMDLNCKKSPSRFFVLPGPLFHPSLLSSPSSPLFSSPCLVSPTPPPLRKV